MLNFSQFEVLTLDCYGTLVDWESGIFSALKPVIARNHKTVSDANLLELYGEFEEQAEKKYRPYREVLESVVRSFGDRLGFTPTPEEIRALPDSVPQWQPWPDTVDALGRLAKRYRLAIISNIDDQMFNATREQLHPVVFQSVTTAQQAQCYKPGLEIFHLALKRAGVPASRILHVGQSIYHDVLPAQTLGLATVWVNRPSPRVGVGAVRKAEGKPDLEVPDLATLAKHAGC